MYPQVGGDWDLPAAVAPRHHRGRQLPPARRQPRHVGLPRQVAEQHHNITIYNLSPDPCYRLLTLRKTLHNFLTLGPATAAIYRRWRWQVRPYLVTGVTTKYYLPPPSSPQCAQQNYQSGLALTEAEWTAEWSSVLRLASPDPRTSSSNNNNNNNNNSSGSSKRRSRLSTVCEDTLDPLYESLEEVHVLVLAHVLRRPIIVVSDTVLKVSKYFLPIYLDTDWQDAYGEALAPISFGGIYLPLEVSQAECDKSPLLLTYDSGHFSALVTMQ